MVIKAFSKASVIILLLAGSAASAQSVATSSFRLQLSVPVICTVSHRASLSVAGDGYMLGGLREYCNSPNGYSLVVDYAPGSMRGAVVSVGDERVTLDGSGHTVISHAPGPRNVDREIYAAPGPLGFDTDHLEFSVQAS